MHVFALGGGFVSGNCLLANRLYKIYGKIPKNSVNTDEDCSSSDEKSYTSIKNIFLATLLGAVLCCIYSLLKYRPLGNDFWENFYSVIADEEIDAKECENVVREYAKKLGILSFKDREAFLNSYVYSTKNLSLGTDNSIYVKLPGGYNMEIYKFYCIMDFVLCITHMDDYSEDDKNFSNLKNVPSCVMYIKFQYFYNKFLFSKESLVDIIKSELSTIKKLLINFYYKNSDKYINTKQLNSELEKTPSKYDFYNMFKQKGGNSEVDKYLKDRQEKIFKYLKKLTEPGVYFEIREKYNSQHNGTNDPNKMGKQQNSQEQIE